MRVDNISEKKRAPIVFRNSAKKLAAHKRVQLRVLIDRPVHASQQSQFLKPSKMRLKIKARTQPVLFHFTAHCKAPLKTARRP
jgi:hypothetical protein